MNQSKYNQKYDPKHNGSQPGVTPVSAPVSASAQTVLRSNSEIQADKQALDTKPAQPVAAPQPEARNQAAAPSDTKSGEAMVSEGGHTATANVPHAVREPSVSPAAPAEGEKAPAILAKPIS
jgi:hypothetical protein